MQLELFHGEHIPLIRARAALERGDLRGAHEAFASACAAGDGGAAPQRLGILERLLLPSGGASPEDVHGVFATAFEVAAARDPVSAGQWFRLYAAHMAQALAAAPAREFRGWCGLDFELAAGRPRAALAATGGLVSSEPAAWVWLEAARAAHAAGEAALARRWILIGCLSARAPLLPDPPLLTPIGSKELDAPGFSLPELPRALAALWGDALELELSGPACAWVPSLGVIDGVVAPAELRLPEVARAGGLHLEPSETRDPPPVAFLRALITAREVRHRETPTGTGCGAIELRARSEMKRAAPLLFARYMERIGLGL